MAISAAADQVQHYAVKEQYLQGARMTFAPITWSRTLRDIAAKVIDLVGELFLRLRGLVPLKEIKDPATTFEAQTAQGSNIVSVVTQLQRFQRLDPALFEEYKTQLAKTHPNVLLDTTFLTFNNTVKFPKLPELSEGENAAKSLILIPLILKGVLEDHIVLFAYDVHNQTAYYYDSQGKPIRTSQKRVLRGSNFTLGYFMKKVTDTYENIGKSYSVKNYLNETGIYENTQKHQWNCTDCGIYVFLKMQTLIGRLDPSLNSPNEAENPDLNGCSELLSRDPVPGSSAQAREEILQILQPE